MFSENCRFIRDGRENTPAGDTPKIRGFSGCVQKVLKTIPLVVGFFKASQNK